MSLQLKAFIMKKITILFFLIAGLTAISFSQDIIVKTNGSTIKCKVIEVGLDVIKYKRLDNIDGPDYFIDKASVKEIRYENGTKDSFGQEDQKSSLEGFDLIRKERRGFISFTLGPAIPVGDFGSGDLNNPKAGLANTGFQLNLVNFGYRFSKHIGIAGLWNGVSHTIKYTDDGIWSHGYMLGGLLITFPSEKIDFDIRIMGGLMNATAKVPSLNFEASGLGFGYDFGGAIRFHLGKIISLMVTTDYAAGKPTLSSAIVQGFEQDIATVNFTVGVAFRMK